MTQFNMYETKTNFSKIAKMLEDGVEDSIIVSRNGKPILEIKLYETNKREKFFGCGKNLFEIPEDFDDIDISEDFVGEIL